MKLGLTLNERRKTADCICGGDTPAGFGATEFTRFEKHESRVQLSSPYLRTDFAIGTGLAP